MKNRELFSTVILATLFILTSPVFGEETKTEKVETIGNKAVDAAKRTFRNAKDEVCELIDGKAKCVVKKAVNKIKDTADKIDTTATEVKNKAD